MIKLIALGVAVVVAVGAFARTGLPEMRRYFKIRGM
jgi:hypothetical protein